MSEPGDTESWCSVCHRGICAHVTDSLLKLDADFAKSERAVAAARADLLAKILDYLRGCPVCMDNTKRCRSCEEVHDIADALEQEFGGTQGGEHG